MEFLSDECLDRVLHRNRPASTTSSSSRSWWGDARQRDRRVVWGWGFAMVSRLLLLFTLSWVMG
jgi:hypothetical protein